MRGIRMWIGNHRFYANPDPDLDRLKNENTDQDRHHTMPIHNTAYKIYSITVINLKCVNPTILYIHSNISAKMSNRSGHKKLIDFGFLY
jgi:hypothetical protein